jgi:hypothetical protein
MEHEEKEGTRRFRNSIADSIASVGQSDKTPQEQAEYLFNMIELNLDRDKSVKDIDKDSKEVILLCVAELGKIDINYSTVLDDKLAAEGDVDKNRKFDLYQKATVVVRNDNIEKEEKQAKKQAREDRKALKAKKKDEPKADVGGKKPRRSKSDAATLARLQKPTESSSHKEKDAIITRDKKDKVISKPTSVGDKLNVHKPNTKTARPKSANPLKGARRETESSCNKNKDSEAELYDKKGSTFASKYQDNNGGPTGWISR